MRVRSRGNMAAAPTFSEITRDTTPATAWSPTGFSVGGIKTGILENFVDTISPKFFTARASGKVFFNSMSKTVESVSSSGSLGWYIKNLTNAQHAEYQMEGDVYQYFAKIVAGTNLAGNLNVGSAVSDSDIADAATEVSTEVLAGRGRSDSNIYESLAEADQAIGLAGDATKQFTKILKGIPLRKIQAVGSLYLLYRYGVRPLLGDITNIVESLSVEPEKIRSTTRARVSLSGIDTRTVMTPMGIIQCFTQILGEDTVLLRGMSLDEFIKTSASVAGFDVKGLFTLPWELVPFSFVADWFANIGSLLGSLVPTPGVAQLGSCLVIERSRHWTYTGVSSSLTDANYQFVMPVLGSCQSSILTKTRGPLSQPGLVVRSDFKFKNLLRTLDAIALAEARLRVMQKLFDLAKRSRK